MEPASTSDGAEAPALPVYSVNVLQVVRDAQSIHGLKHSDYQRYRQYCSRRLRRIYKGVKFLHGRGRYQKKKLEPENVKEERHIHIPLVQAERAWAHAMELKNQARHYRLSSGVAHVEQEMEPQKRHHLISLLSKAAAHAAELVRLASQRCDARTQLEAEAYSSWMAGSMLLEKESDWEQALARFVRARRLFEELAKVGSYDQQGVCKHFLDQVEPTIRFCQYQISRRGGAAPDPSELLDLRRAAWRRMALGCTDAKRNSGGCAALWRCPLCSALSGAGVGDQLQSKLASLAAVAQAQRAASTSEMTWGGESYPVRDERVRVALHAAQELQSELDSGMEVEGGAEAEDGGASDADARVGLFDRTVNAYTEARAAIRSALQLGTGGADSESVRSELASLDRAVAALTLQLTIRRNLFLAGNAAERLARGQRRALKAGQKAAGQKAKGGERSAKPEDVVRLYETLAANVADLNEVAAEVGGAQGEALMDACSAQLAHFAAARCLYLAHSYLGAGKPREALALFRRAQASAGLILRPGETCTAAEERVREATARHAESSAPDAEAAGQLRQLEAAAGAWALVAAGELAAEAARAQEGVQAGVAGISLGGEAVPGRKRKAAAYLEDSPQEWEPFVEFAGKAVTARIARLPPLPSSVPVRPIVLDAALAHIQLPSLAAHLPKQAAAGSGLVSGVGRLFGWGGGS
eukprot:scaffold6.g2852.t1